jgi:Na+-driven multidrug efflux pump
VLPRFFGVEGVWLSMCGSDFIAFVVSLVTVIVMVRRLNNKFKNITPLAQPA